MEKDILTMRVSREETEVGINGSLQEIIIATCAGINAIYNSVIKHGELYRAFVATAVADPNSPVWDINDGTANGEGYEMDASNIEALQNILSRFANKEGDDEDSD